jgi:hypothetical protein
MFKEKPAPPPGSYLERWKKAKRLFESTTKQKKPNGSIMGAFHRAGLDPAIRKVDEYDDNAHKSEGDLKNFAGAIKNFIKAKTDYMKVLETAVTKTPKGVEQETYKKGIKVLKTELNALELTFKSRYGYAQGALKHQGTTETMAQNLMVTIEATCARALALVARVKANPTPDAFNTDIRKAARDITQQIGNIDKLKAKGHVIAKDQPTNLFKILAAWGDAGRQVPPTATRDEVLREVGAFEQAVKGVKKWAA